MELKTHSTANSTRIQERITGYYQHSVLQKKLQVLEKGTILLGCAVIKQSESLKMIQLNLTRLGFAFNYNIVDEFRIFPFLYL